MPDYYEILGIERNTRTEDIPLVFNRLLGERRARRQKTSDLHAAFAVLADPVLRAAYDGLLPGGASRLDPRNLAGEAALFIRDVVTEIDVQEVAAQVREVTLKSVVLASRFTGKASEAAAKVSHAVERAALKRLSSRSDS